MAKKSKAHVGDGTTMQVDEASSGDVDSSTENLYVTLDETLSRVIGELTEMRIRQRALLDVLRATGVSWELYVDAVRAVRKRDFQPLLASVVYKHDAFIEHFGEWIKEDTKRYLYSTGQVSMSALQTKPDVTSKTRARRKKRNGDLRAH